MKERPIIMSGDSVRAILNGTKTMTRRVIKPQPRGIVAMQSQARTEERNWHWDDGSDDWAEMRRCPFEVGQHLWVRETWRIMGLMYEEEPCIQYKADLAEQPCYVPDDWLDMRWEDWYERQSAKLVEDCEKAGLKPNNDYDELYRWERDTCPTRWQPSIHLPKFAARIWVEIADVRPERLQEISKGQIAAEGIAFDWYEARPYPEKVHLQCKAFRDLWDSLNAKRGYGWATNPFVWVLSFKVLA